MTRKEHITELLKCISEGVYEKEHILSLSLLCCVAGESLFMLGPPGTAKSMVARRIKEVFVDSSSFEYLMSRFSTPDEIFGPVSISKLKNEDVYERSVEGFLPTVSVVFLDEIWKAGPAIQNALLTVINERIYQNGKCCIHLPMKMLIAASNELPAEDEGLEALWDRFLVRVISNNIEDEEVFYKMLLDNENKHVEVPQSIKVSDNLFHEWQSRISKVAVGKDILHILTEIRKCLKALCEEEDIVPLDYYVSDRRWKKIVHLLQTSAFLNDREKVDHSDMLLLYHVLWNKTETISKVCETVSRALLFDIVKKKEQLEKKLDKCLKSFNSKDVVFCVYDHFYNRLKDFPKGKCYFTALEYKYLSLTKDSDGVLYYDNIKDTYYIRKFDASNSSSMPLFGNVEKIKIRRHPNGICVNGELYAFDVKRKNSDSESNEMLSNDYVINSVEQLLKEFCAIEKTLSDRKEVMCNPTNIFISNQDCDVMKGYIKPLEKEMNGLGVKMKGYSLSL